MGYASLRCARAAAGPWHLPAFGVPAVALGLWVSTFLVVVAIVARAAGSFDAGLWAAAAVGTAWALASYRWAQPTEGGRADRRTYLRFGIALVGLLLLYGYVSYNYQINDEHPVFGHLSMVEQLRRDVYPLYYPSQPMHEARYHYGFDIIAGSLARGYGLDADNAIDLVCLLMVLFMAFGAAAVAADADAVKSAPLAALAIHLGGGLAWLMLVWVPDRHPRCFAQYHHPSCKVELFPTPFLNVFQHPVSVGVPLFLVAVLLLPRSLHWPTVSHRKQYVGLAAGATILLAGTSVGQFVYYALGALAALAAFPVVLWRKGWASLAGPAVLLGVILVSFGLAYFMGGMLAFNPTIDPSLVTLRAELGFPKETSLFGIGYHHAANLGLGFLLIPVFLVAALRDRRPPVVMLLAFSIGGILVAHLFIYSRSWDIVKFPSAASFALSLLYVLVIDRFLGRCKLPLQWVQRLGAVLILGAGSISALYLVVPLPGKLRLYSPGRWQGNPLVREVIQWMREHDYQSEQVIYALPNVARELSLFGGLSVVAQDSDMYYMGIRLNEMYRVQRLSKRIESMMNGSALRELQVHYIVISDEELPRLGRVARAQLNDTSRFEEVAAFEADKPEQTRRIFRVKRIQPSRLDLQPSKPVPMAPVQKLSPVGTSSKSPAGPVAK